MNIVATQERHLEHLKAWFPDKSSCYLWGGPGLRYPFTDASFQHDIAWGQIPSYSLLDPDDRLIGFGQYYAKNARCHLARLAIAPDRRGRGLGRRFIARLMTIGREDIQTRECSLFVVTRNEGAVRCYRSLNFESADYPPGHERFEGIAFMVCRSPVPTE